ncbi:MAG: iron-containing redox enzyme family protein [Candidatus Neomarinimicrobiota bacterium]
MNQTEVLDTLDALIQSRSILGHPFYEAWQSGELTRENIATYAKVYYPHVEAFPGYLESAVNCTVDPVIRSELEQNLADELSNPKPHSELWLDFAEELGQDRQLVTSTEPHPAAVSTISTFVRLTRRDIVSALAALYAYESQQPGVSREKMRGLRQHYGIRSEKGLAYFGVHASTDIRHREGEREALLRCLNGGASKEAALHAASDALDAYWKLLDGICQEVDLHLAN